MPVPNEDNPKPKQDAATDAELDEMLAEIEPKEKKKAPARKAPSILMLGCFGFLVFTVCVVLAVGGLALLRASDAGVTMAMARQQPELASAAIGYAFNPEMELVKVDRYRAQLTVREKRTGQTRMVTADELRRRRAQGFGGGQQAGKHGGKGGLFSLFRSGTRILGMGPSLPDWLPSYPGAKAGGNMVNENPTGVVGIARFMTGDRPAHVMRFYERQLRSAGFAVTVDQSGVDGTGAVTADRSDDPRTVVVRVSRTGRDTTISITYSQPT